MDHWGAIVRDMKDSEKTYGREPLDTERMARHILGFVRYTRIRQWTLFVQQRGEEFERMIGELDDPTAAARMVENEEFWKTTLEMAEQ